EAAPEEVDWARLPDELATELRKQPLRVGQPMEERQYVVAVVRGVALVLLERDRLGDLDRVRPDPDVDVHRAKPCQQAPVERRDRHRLKIEPEGPAVTVDDGQAMPNEIQLDLEEPRALGHRARRQAPC